ncbi:MAG: putative lipid II flippase FtsW [Chloroflexi bacterium]|nr:putative lipid II flippase FtsW [Chloroflexota bacterium]
MLRILPGTIPANRDDDEQHARWPDVPLTVLMLALPLIGLIAIYSASIAVAYAETGDPHFYFRRQLLFLVVGFAAAFTMMRIDYHWFGRIQFLGINLSFWLLAAAVAVLVLMAVTDIGHLSRGSVRWIRWGPLSLQPSELVKPVIALYLAQVLARRDKGANRLVYFLAPTLLVGLVAAIIAQQPDLGTAIMILLIGMSILVAARIPLLYLAGFLVAGSFAAWYAIVLHPYRLQRLTAYLDPFNPQYQDNVAHHNVQALYAFASGKITGVGLGRGMQKFFYMPEPHTDTIFAVIGEELGLIGTLAVLSLFVLLAWRGFGVAVRAPDLFGQLLALGLTCGLFGQAILNMAVVTGMLPFTGIPLPFVSAGGSSLLASSIAMGLLLNISTQTTQVTRNKSRQTWHSRPDGGRQV